MFNLNTKAKRTESRDYQFNRLLNDGYSRETYKTLDFFTKNDGKYFTLKVFRGTGSHHIEYMNYRSDESRAAKIQGYKDSHERRITYKAEQKAKGYTSSHAGASAAVKAELMAAFPGIKFSCKSESFSNGNSVHIEWTDGPTADQVTDISKKYQYGHFNGMEDIYEYTNSREDIPQAKYVSEHRNMSDNVKSLLPEFEKWFDPESKNDYRNSPEQIFREVFLNTSLPADYTDLKIEKTDCMASGYRSDFYKFTYNSPQTEVKAKAEVKAVEVPEGEIQIIEYGKGIAVIGNTKPIKDILGRGGLNGIFNPRLSCGPGWIFPKNRLQEVTEAIQATQTDNIDKPIEVTAEAVEQAQSITEARAGVRNEVVKMINAFAKVDIETCGHITESTKEAARVQCVTIDEDSIPKQYNNLRDIEAAAKGGKIISLTNLYNLANHVNV
jgi:hypothetical protein